MNISQGGVCLKLQGLGKFVSGDAVSVFLQNFEPLQARVRWVKDRSLGLEFDVSATGHAQLQRLLARLADGESPFL